MRRPVEREAGDTGETGDAGEDAEALGFAPDIVAWSLAWDASDFVAVDAAGNQVEIDAAWIGSWGVTLVACSSAELEPATSAGEGPRGLASPSTPQAGHASGEDDPSAWVFAVVESAGDVDPRIAPIRETTGTRYCEAHYLIAPISDASEGFAAAEAALQAEAPELSLAGASLVVLGRWTPAGGGEAVPLVIRSEQAYGKILPVAFDELDSPSDLRDGGEVEVEVTRELASMFTDVDLAALGEDELAWAVLGNLAKHTRVTARPPAG